MKSSQTTRCKAVTQAGAKCKNKAWKDGVCKIHSDDWSSEKKKGVGQGLTETEVEQLYADLFNYHIIGGVPVRECARILKVNVSTIKYRYDDFKQWMKENYPQQYDGEFIMNRYLSRMEDLRQSLQTELLNSPSKQERVMLSKRIVEIDDRILRLHQDARAVPAATKISREVELAGTVSQPTTVLFAMDPSLYDDLDGRGRQES